MFEFITQHLPYGNLIDTLLIIFVFIIAAKTVSFIFKRIMHKLAAKTSTVLDDLLAKAINTPLLIAIMLLGVYYAALDLSVLAAYTNQIMTWFAVLFILLGAIALVRIINAFIEWYMTEVAVKTKTKADEQFMPIIRKAAYTAVGLLALLWILREFGVDIFTLGAALGIGGLAIALAFQDTLKEFFAGTYVILDRPVRIGDYIELESGERGYVTDISWRSTKIRMLGDNMLIIPNSKLASSKIINYDMPKHEMSVSVPVGVSYDSDLDKVEKITIKVAKKVLKEVPGGKQDFEPFVRFKEFGDSNINFKVVMRVKTYVDRYRLVHEFIKALKKEYDKHGIEISWPVVKLYNYHAKKW